MANTYTQIHIHLILVVKRREKIIPPDVAIELEKYITSIIQIYGHKMLAVKCMPEHVHVFFGMKPVGYLSELVKELKCGSSKWINDNRKINRMFRWQTGYAAFSHSNSAVKTVIRYILNQEQHHNHVSLEREYEELIIESGIEFERRYLFDQ